MKMTSYKNFVTNNSTRTTPSGYFQDKELLDWGCEHKHDRSISIHFRKREEGY